MDRISYNYKKIDISTIEILAKDINSLARLFVDGAISLVEINSSTIGICATVNTFSNSKSVLHRHEPVVICIDRNDWESVVPYSFSDRPDFPYNSLPHMNYEHDEIPPTFCLSRESIEDWYAEHTLTEYVSLLSKWLRDAAKGELMKLNKNDEFEPQRIHHLDKFLLRASFNDTLLENKPNPICDSYSIEIHNEAKHIAYGYESYSSIIGNAIGLRLFAGNKNVDSDWYSHYPTTLGELYSFLKDKGYPTDFTCLKDTDLSKIDYIYFQIALLRPRKLIGKNTRINYLCFRAIINNVINAALDSPIEEVTIIDHTDYLSAKYMSKLPESIFTKKVVIIGCGAIGSKIAYHLHRAGIFHISLVDNDNLLPHNICRHAIAEYLPISSFKNKAVLLKESLHKMFVGMPNAGIVSHECTAEHFLKTEDYSNIDLLIDATASVKAMYAINNSKLPRRTKQVRVAISEGGDIGITYIRTAEDTSFPDYYMEVLKASINNNDISCWLQDERKNSTENIRIGEGCHSNTMRISDDTISAHAAIMSLVIKQIFENGITNSIVFSFANKEFSGSIHTKKISIPKYLQFMCENNSEWVIRIPEDHLQEIRRKAKIKGKNETGGFVFGYIDKKRKIIYPILSETPTDIFSSKSRLTLGAKKTNEIKKKYTTRSAGQIIYLGDWHSHPTGSLNMSEIDLATNKDILESGELIENVGLCTITNKTETRFFLISKQLFTQ